MNVTSILRVPLGQLASGTCHICGAHTLLLFTDRSTGQRFGRCCLEFMLFADQLIRPIRPITPIPSHEPTINHNY